MIPFCDPNIRDGHETEDLVKVINVDQGEQTPDCIRYPAAVMCCLSGIGSVYLCAVQILIEQGEYGFSMNNGRPEIMMPGRHLLLSPLNKFMGKYRALDDVIREGPITVVRIPQGQLGFAMNNALPEVLLPGVHARNNANWRFDDSKSVDNELLSYGPIKFLTVKSGAVRVCYLGGKVHIYPEGRYAVNEGTFVVSSYLNTQQQNIRFDKHPVLLDGGISMLVEGLLTYQVVDVELLIKQLGDRDLLRAITDVSKAELSRVFSAIHLEQISSAQSHPEHVAAREAKGEIDTDAKAVLGGGPVKKKEATEGEGGESRSVICAHVVEFISPITEKWGVRIINFQLESIKLADASYARDYEQASLAMAKAKANLRAVKAENEIVLNKANAAAQAQRIEAEGRKQATIIQASGEAEARKIEAQARNDAAKSMTDEFAKQYALTGQQVEFARALKASVLTVLPDSAIGRPFVTSPMFNSDQKSHHK
jgi:regulator of protease activity HflC (stomatin/prohibitin superfamily)